MGHRRYTLEQKIRFLDSYEETGSIKGAARVAGIEGDGPCDYWLRNKDRIREDHARSLAPIEPIPANRVGPAKIPLEEKIRCIRSIEAGLSVHQASIEFNRSLATVQSWYKGKDGLLVLYYSRQNPDAKEDFTQEAAARETAWEVQMAKRQADEDLVRKCKALNKEIEYLKDKVVFLENLNEILKERSGPTKKKRFSPRSIDASEQGEET